MSVFMTASFVICLLPTHNALEMSSTSLAVASSNVISDFSLTSILIWPTVNLYPGPQDQDMGQKNRGSWAKHSHQGQAPGAAQTVQPWDTSDSDHRLLQGRQVGWGVLSRSSQVELERDVALERCVGTVRISKGRDLNLFSQGHREKEAARGDTMCVFISRVMRS